MFLKLPVFVQEKLRHWVICYDSTALAVVHSSRVVNIKNSFIDRFFQYWGTFILLKVSLVQHKTQVTTFPYGCFRGMQFHAHALISPQEEKPALNSEVHLLARCA